MGRKKGSKNKPKGQVVSDQPIAQDVTLNVPVDVEPKKRVRKEYIPDDPSWVLTETAYGTPIAIVDICGTKGDCYLMVIPHYRERNSRTTIISTSVVRPNFSNRQVEEQFDGIRWCTASIIPVPDTLNVDVPGVGDAQNVDVSGVCTEQKQEGVSNA